MNWQWHRRERSKLAAFANPHILQPLFDIPYSKFLEQRKHEHFHNYASSQLRKIYSRLSAHKIVYEADPPNPRALDIQKIRTPEAIHNQKKGTCLDLALLFASCCIASDLIPVVIVSPANRSSSHAFLAISLTHGLLECLDEDRLLFDELDSADLVVSADQWSEVNFKSYLAIECIGITRDDSNQVEPMLSFKDAIAQGAELATQTNPSFCVDCALMQYSRRVPLESADGQPFPQIDQLHQKWKQWASNHRFSFSIELLSKTAEIDPPLKLDYRNFINAEEWGHSIRLAVNNLWTLVPGQFPNKVLEKSAEILSECKEINWSRDFDDIVRKLRPSIQRVASMLHKEKNSLQSEDVSQQVVDHFDMLSTRANSLKDKLESPHYNKCFLISGSFGSGKSYFFDQILSDVSQDQQDTSRLLIIQPQLTSSPDLDQAICSFFETELGIPTTLKKLNDVLAFNNYKLVIVLENLQEYFRIHPKSASETIKFLIDTTKLSSVRFLVSINFNGYDQISRYATVWKRLSSGNSSELQHGGWHLLDRINTSEQLGLKILEKDIPSLSRNIQYTNTVVKYQLCSPLLAKLASRFGIQEHNILNFKYIDFFEAFRNSLNEIDVQPFAIADIEYNIACLAKYVGTTGELQVSRSELLSIIEIAPAQKNEFIDCLQRMSVLYVLKQNGSEFLVQLSFELFWAYWIATAAVDELHNKNLDERISILTRQANTLNHPGLRELVIELTLLLLDEVSFQEGFWNQILIADFPTRNATFFAGVNSNSQRKEEIKSFIKAVRQGRKPYGSARDFFAMLHFITECDEVPIQHFVEICRGRDTKRPFKNILDSGLEDYFYFVFQVKLRSTSDLRSISGAIKQLSSSHHLKFPLEMASGIWKRIIEIENCDQVIIELMQHYLESDARIFESEYAINRKLQAKRSKGDMLDSFELDTSNRKKPGKSKGGKPIYFREYLVDNFFDWIIKREGATFFEFFKNRSWFSNQASDSNSNCFPAGLQRELKKRWAFSCGEFFRWKAGSQERKDYIVFVVKLSKSDEKLNWHTAWFMMRHTTRIENQVAYVHSDFSEALNEIRDKPNSEKLVARNKVELAPNENY